MIRNNNPGNIRGSQDKWVGKIGEDSRGFVVFDTLPHGYRALFKLLDGYMKKGFNTVEKIITRWAPPSENDTEAYIKNVSKWINKPRGEKLSKIDLLVLGLAISRQEHGKLDNEAAKNGLALIYRDEPTAPTAGSFTPLPIILIILGLGFFLFRK